VPVVILPRVRGAPPGADRRTIQVGRTARLTSFIGFSLPEN